MLSSAFANRWTAARSFVLLFLVVAATSLTVIVSAEQAKTRSSTQVYLAMTGSNVDCETLFGGACFPLQGDELEAAIGVLDDAGTQPVAARYEFRDAQGGVVETKAFCETTTVSIPEGATELAVMVAAFDVLICGEPATATTGVIKVVSKISDGEFGQLHVTPQQCLQATPRAISVLGVTEPEDEGQIVFLDTYVLLDDVEQQRADVIMAATAEAYRTLGIELRWVYREVDLPDDARSGQLMMSLSMNELGGEVPVGFDVVHLLTSRRLNVSGQASCIGGVAYPDRAFSVARSGATTLVTAHEIGHTMGAHHHYGNCIEAPLAGRQRCTVMVSGGTPPAFWAWEPRFSSVNGAIIRAHAVRWADSETIVTKFSDLAASTRGDQVTVTGRLLTEAGEPVDHASVLLRARSDEWVTATTGNDGSFTAVLQVPDHGRSVEVTARFDGAGSLAPSEGTTTATWRGGHKT